MSTEHQTMDPRARNVTRQTAWSPSKSLQSLRRCLVLTCLVVALLPQRARSSVFSLHRGRQHRLPATARRSASSTTWGLFLPGSLYGGSVADSICRISAVPRGGVLLGDDDEEEEEEEDDAEESDSSEGEEEEYDVEEEGEEDEYDSESEEEEDEDMASFEVDVSKAEYDDPLVPSPLNNLYATLAVMLLSKRIDLFNPTVVRIAR